MDKRPSIIGRMFDRIAPTYDLLNTVLSFSLDKSWRRAAINLLEIRAGDAVLDIATGTGDLAIPIAHSGGNVIGVDLSRQMLLRALGKADEQGLRTRYSVVQGDALSMPFRNETFNSALVAFGIRNMNNLEAFLAEIHRVLNTNGRFAVLEFSLPESPLWRCIYGVYLKYAVPVIGGLISGDYDAYRYLRDSVTEFPVPRVLEEIMKGQDFRIVRSRSIFGGVSHLFLIEKQR
ncbi:MAG TPA: bifunctional demethylmenaquinone methyltransferase/2-methoxy-6-polyprenyl-1,4-benzoquinol methylase UbiE [Syntrophales bacterium]|nr:bifunctional demethylmenaquinone methyltransferase/2-methoxy-6-polyprenyl-1,4-benzoquinol methylase UbiE [Syntrophales bacterium]